MMHAITYPNRLVLIQSCHGDRKTIMDDMINKLTALRALRSSVQVTNKGQLNLKLWFSILFEEYLIFSRWSILVISLSQCLNAGASSFFQWVRINLFSVIRPYERQTLLIQGNLQARTTRGNQMQSGLEWSYIGGARPSKEY